MRMVDSLLGRRCRIAFRADEPFAYRTSAFWVDPTSGVLLVAVLSEHGATNVVRYTDLEFWTQGVHP